MFFKILIGEICKGHPRAKEHDTVWMVLKESVCSFLFFPKVLHVMLNPCAMLLEEEKARFLAVGEGGGEAYCEVGFDGEFDPFVPFGTVDDKRVGERFQGFLYLIYIKILERDVCNSPV